MPPKIDAAAGTMAVEARDLSRMTDNVPVVVAHACRMLSQHRTLHSTIRDAVTCLRYPTHIVLIVNSR
eukprot:3480648-Rhodomonas_salina.2